MTLSHPWLCWVHAWTVAFVSCIGANSVACRSGEDSPSKVDSPPPSPSRFARVFVVPELRGDELSSLEGATLYETLGLPSIRGCGFEVEPAGWRCDEGWVAVPRLDATRPGFESELPQFEDTATSGKAGDLRAYVRARRNEDRDSRERATSPAVDRLDAPGGPPRALGNMHLRWWMWSVWLEQHGEAELAERCRETALQWAVAEASIAPAEFHRLIRRTLAASLTRRAHQHVCADALSAGEHELRSALQLVTEIDPVTARPQWRRDREAVIALQRHVNLLGTNAPERPSRAASLRQRIDDHLWAMMRGRSSAPRDPVSKTGAVPTEHRAAMALVELGDAAVPMLLGHLEETALTCVPWSRERAYIPLGKLVLHVLAGIAGPSEAPFGFLSPDRARAWWAQRQR